MSWWIPLAFVGAAVAGIALAYALAAGTRARGPAARPAGPHGSAGGAAGTRYEIDNRVAWNPGAFLAFAVVIGGIALAVVLIEVL